MTDIVDRLWEVGTILIDGKYIASHPELLLEAADEIERLRKIIRTLLRDGTVAKEPWMEEE